MSNGLQAQASGASYPTICRFIARIPYMLKVAFREGEKPFDDKVMPHMEIDYSSEAMLAGDWFTSDGHTLNLFCRNADGNFVRPTLDAFMDKACRKLMGFEVAETESSELVAKALYRSIADNEYILPLNVHIDNGKAYKNKQSRGDFENELEGYYSRLGIKPHFAIPYNAKAKQIERFWRTVDEYFSKMFDTYCGRNIDDKPEILTELMKKAKAHPELVPTMDEVRDRFKKEFMTWYNDKVHTGHGMDGRTPNERWAEEAEDFRVIEPEKLRIALMPRYVKTVRRNGIQYLGYYYRDAEMKTALIQKQKVEIAVDADDITKILVFDRDGQFLFSADRKERSRFADEPDVKTIEAYKANQREERQIRKLKSQVMGLEGKRSAKRNIIIAEPVREELEAKQDVQKKLKGPLDID
jgi:putative transposase